MNSLIETLNRCGENVLHFAWPMLWQSSVLIAVLFAFDFALRRHVRAAVRYALWLVLLVKLLLPPSLALPTGAAWWLRPDNAPRFTPPPAHYTVSYDTDVQPALLPTLPAIAMPPPQLSPAAWTIPAWAIAGAALLAWMIFRWRQIYGLVQKAAPASQELNDLFMQAKQTTGIRQTVELRLTDQSLSPAVCGLFRPVVLLPRSLVDKLEPGQLRTVLLHELFHLRRGDVWTNCLQALIQIVYWWHPLLWLANARIRRIREEAVDDAVMLALHDEAEVYAPTLLEVAKLAFHRPLASLGLVGILESRSALRQRIERLLNFRAPRKAGLTLVSFCGVCVFSAMALPMGEATTAADKQLAAQSAQLEQSLTVKVNPEVFIKNVKAQARMYLHNATNDYTGILLDILHGEGVDCHPPHGLAFNNKTGEITTQNTPEALDVFRQVIEQLNRRDGQCNLLAIPAHRQGVLIQGELYRMRSADFDNLTKGLHHYDNPRFSNLPWWSVEPGQFAAFGDRVKSLGLQPLQRPRIQTGHGITAQLYCGNETNSIELSCLPFVTVDETQRFVELTVQVNTKGWFTDNPAGDWPVHDGTNRYAVSGQVSAEDHGGIVLRAKNPAGDNLVVILGIQIVTNDAPALKPASGVNTSLLVRGESRKNIAAKLDRIRFDSVSWPDGLPLSEVLRNLSDQTRLRDPDKKGINFLFNPNAQASPGMFAASPAGTPTTIAQAADASSINIKLNLSNVRLADVLDAIVLVADHPIQYSIEDYGVVFSGKEQTSPPLFTRTFKVDTNVFLANLRKQTALQTDVSAALKQLLSNVGVELSPPKSIFFNDRLGVLFVHATSQDLDAVEKAVMALSYSPPPQIHIKAQFFKVPEETAKGLGTNFTPTGATNLVGILTDPDFQLVLHTLEQNKATECLAKPEVITLGGRQTQMRVTDVLTIITNFVFQETSTNPAITPQQSQVEVGPVLDVVPSILPDGHTIDLTLIASLTEFLGYDTPPTNSIPVTTSKGVIVRVPTILPKFDIRQAVTHVELQNGQTVVLGGMVSTQVHATKNKVPVLGSIPLAGRLFRSESRTTTKNSLLVFVTATLVDRAGNRIHSDDEMPFARAGIPPQDSR